MYTLIKNKITTKRELEEYYTLDEFLKLWALFDMDTTIQLGKAQDMERSAKRG